MYVVQSGKVEVVHTTESGEDQQLATLKAGEFFGEMAIFEDEVRSATVRAVGDTRVLEVDKKTRREADPGRPAARRQHAEDDVLPPPRGTRAARRGVGARRVSSA